MGGFWLFLIVTSMVLTFIVANHFHLKGIGRMAILNVLLPFAGLVYALYIVHVIIPKIVKQQTGESISSPLIPYLKHYLALAIQAYQKILKKLKEK